MNIFTMLQPSNSFFHTLVIILLLSCLTAVTRFLPFWLQTFFDRSVVLRQIGELLPSAIMLLLVFHMFEDVSFIESPFGVPELLSLSVAVMLYVWKRNLLLSLLPGAIIYLVIVNNVFNFV